MSLPLQSAVHSFMPPSVISMYKYHHRAEDRHVPILRPSSCSDKKLSMKSPRSHSSGPILNMNSTACSPGFHSCFYAFGWQLPCRVQKRWCTRVAWYRLLEVGTNWFAGFNWCGGTPPGYIGLTMVPPRSLSRGHRHRAGGRASFLGSAFNTIARVA